MSNVPRVSSIRTYICLPPSVLSLQRTKYINVQEDPLNPAAEASTLPQMSDELRRAGVVEFAINTLRPRNQATADRVFANLNDNQAWSSVIVDERVPLEKLKDITGVLQRHAARAGKNLLRFT